MGVPPEQIIDYKALVGDPSDNYKGVPGIGPKTAIKLLKDYGDLDTIYKNLDKLSEKTKSLLVKNKDSAYVSQRLATIVRDVDLDNNLEEMKKWQLDSKKVLDLFEEIGFKTLTRRVKEIGKKIEDEKQMTLV
jgi:DNA polymerase-1